MGSLLAGCIRHDAGPLSACFDPNESHASRFCPPRCRTDRLRQERTSTCPGCNNSRTRRRCGQAGRCRRSGRWRTCNRCCLDRRSRCLRKTGAETRGQETRTKELVPQQAQKAGLRPAFFISRLVLAIRRFAARRAHRPDRRSRSIPVRNSSLPPARRAPDRDDCFPG